MPPAMKTANFVLIGATCFGHLIAGLVMVLEGSKDKFRGKINVTSTLGWLKDQHSDDMFELNIFHLIGVALLLACLWRLISLIGCVWGDLIHWIPFIKRDANWQRLNIGRWLETATSLPLIMIAVFATIGDRAITTHVFIAICFIAFAGFGLVNDALLNIDPGVVREAAGDDGEDDDVEGGIVKIGGKRFNARVRRRNVESVGWRSNTDGFKNRSSREFSDKEGSNIAHIVPFVAQLCIFVGLMFAVTRLLSDDADADADSDVWDPKNSIHRLVWFTFSFLLVWLPVQLINVGWAAQRWEVQLLDLIAMIWMATWMWVVSGMLYFDLWDGTHADAFLF